MQQLLTSQVQVAPRMVKVKSDLKFTLTVSLNLRLLGMKQAVEVLKDNDYFCLNLRLLGMKQEGKAHKQCKRQFKKTKKKRLKNKEMINETLILLYFSRRR